MTHEMKVKTLEGGVVTVEVIPTKTIRELMVMLREKKDCEDPIERQILKVKVLVDGSVPDDDQTLESLGLLHAESEVTVIYYRNEIEAAQRRPSMKRASSKSTSPPLARTFLLEPSESAIRWSGWLSQSL